MGAPVGSAIVSESGPLAGLSKCGLKKALSAPPLDDGFKLTHVNSKNARGRPC